jgi:hypothetical protein
MKLVRWDNARKSLAELRRVDEVKSIRDKALAMQEYARRARDTELMDYATGVRMDSERRLGEVMEERRKAGLLAKGARERGTKRGTTRVSEKPASLRDQGVDKALAHRARKYAAMSDKVYQQNYEATKRAMVAVLERPNAGLGIGSSRVHSLDSRDYFPTPPWVTRTLMEIVLPHYGIDPRSIRQVWEPASGEGHMSEVLKEYAGRVDASDIHDYGHQDFIHDFLNGPPRPADWIATNPPFKGRNLDRALEFTLRALDVARCGVAMLVRTQWATETKERYERLLRDRPPTILAFFIERVGFHPERWDPDGVTLNTGISWCVWLKDKAGLILPPRPPLWIPPGQKEALTRPGDRERFAAWTMEEAAE